MMYTASVSQVFPNIQPNFENIENIDQSLQKSKIPFMFSSSPMRLVDEKIIAKLDGSACKVLFILERFIDLSNQTKIDKRWVLTGWTTVISHDRIAELANLSRRTVIRKIKMLVEAGIITVKKWGRACKYLFMEFDTEITKLEEEYAQKRAFDEELNNLSSDKADPDSDTPDDNGHDGNNGNDSADDSPSQADTSRSDNNPADDQVDSEERRSDQSTATESTRSGAFVNKSRVVLAAPVTGLTPDLSELSHIKDSLIKEVKTLSSRVAKLFRIMETNQTQKSEREQTLQEENNWQEGIEYAQLFYGDIASTKLKKQACLYFKQKADEFGISPDGQDRLILAIPKIKSYGARTHIAFDKEWGVRAYNEVLDEEELRINAPDDIDEEQQEQHNKRNTHKMNYDIETLFKHMSPAAKRMAYAIESRHNAATGVGQKGYSDAEIEKGWQRIYAEYGQPQSHDQWTDDRFRCHQLLVAKGVRKPLSIEETQVIIERANQLFPS